MQNRSNSLQLTKPEEVGKNFPPSRTRDSLLLFGFQPLCTGHGYVIKCIPKTSHSKPVSVTQTTPKDESNWAVHILFTEYIHQNTTELAKMVHRVSTVSTTCFGLYIDHRQVLYLTYQVTIQYAWCTLRGVGTRSRLQKWVAWKSKL